MKKNNLGFCTNLFYVDVLKWTSVKLVLFPCLACDRKSPPQRRIVANIFDEEVGLRSWEVRSTNSVFIIRSQLIYSWAFIWVIAQQFILKGPNVDRNLHKVVFKCEIDDVPSWLAYISVRLHCILESSPQAGFMFDIKKLLLIDGLTFIPGETQDDLLRIAINLPEFRRIFPKQVTLLITAKQKVQYDWQCCITPQLSLLMFHFVAFHHDSY